MMFIKVHDRAFTEYLINTSHITYIANDGRVTSIGLDKKTFLCVSETPDEILELLKSEDPLRSKLLAQTDKIDNMLDNMEKQDPWIDFLEHYFPTDHDNIIRCENCRYHDSEDFCYERGRKTRSDDYCSFGKEDENENKD